MVKKPGYPAASRRVSSFFSFTFNEDDDVRLLSKIGEQRGLKRGIFPWRGTEKFIEVQFRFDFSKRKSVFCNFAIPLLLISFSCFSHFSFRFYSSLFLFLLLFFCFFYSTRRNVFNVYSFSKLKSAFKMSGIERGNKNISFFSSSFSSSSSCLFSFFLFFSFVSFWLLNYLGTEWGKSFFLFFFFLWKDRKAIMERQLEWKKKVERWRNGEWGWGRGGGGGGGGIFVRTGHGTKVSSRISEGNNNNNNNAVDVRCHGGKKKFGTLPFISALFSPRLPVEETKKSNMS